MAGRGEQLIHHRMVTEALVVLQTIAQQLMRRVANEVALQIAITLTAAAAVAVAMTMHQQLHV